MDTLTPIPSPQNMMPHTQSLNPINRSRKVIRRRVAGGLIGVIVLAIPVAASATVRPCAFTAHDLLVRQTALRYALNHSPIDAALKLLGHSPLPAVAVQCRGIGTVKLSTGAQGWYKIRCTTSLETDDYLYSLSGSGVLQTRRVDPNS